MKNIMDNLIEKIKECNNPTVIGVDTRYELVPECVRNKYAKDINGEIIGTKENIKSPFVSIEIMIR